MGLAPCWAAQYRGEAPSVCSVLLRAPSSRPWLSGGGARRGQFSEGRGPTNTGAAGGGAASASLSGAGGPRRRRGVVPSLSHHGSPRRSGPLCGCLLAGTGIRRGRFGGAAGRCVRRRVLRWFTNLRGRHRHLPQPHLVGVLVRGQPGGVARGAARRRGAGTAQGPRGQRAAGFGARLQPPPLFSSRHRVSFPPRRRPGAAARPRPAAPLRRRQQASGEGGGVGPAGGRAGAYPAGGGHGRRAVRGSWVGGETSCLCPGTQEIFSPHAELLKKSSSKNLLC